ncbi:MAG: glycosyltransferase family 39 protein [Fibrobacter sp.]|nr:glycosyltransferase family 39 protein [Fibrobacter sp.]
MSKVNLFKYGLLAVIAVTLFTSFTFQGSRGLYESTEGRYAECGLEMLTSGNYLVPTLNNVPHWTKPPLTYWAIASGIRIFGKNEWGVRIGNSIAFLISVIAVYFIAMTMWNKTVALYAGLIYATSPFAIVGVNSVSTDQLLTMWELLSVLCYWLFLRRGSGIWMSALGVCSGLAFLTKGPPGLLAVLVMIVFHLFSGKKLRKAGVLRVLIAITLFLVTGLSWYLYSVINNPDLLGYFLGKEVYARVFTDHFKRNPQWYAPLYVYGLPLISGVGGWIICFRNGFKEIRTSYQGAGRFIRERKILFFLLIWFLLPLIVLSISKSRLPLYVLPFFPAMVLIAARLADKMKMKLKTLIFITIISATVCVGLKKYAQYVPSSSNMGSLYTTWLKNEKFEKFILFDTDAYYGIQFYTHPRCIRTSVDADSQKNYQPIAQVLKSINPGSQVFLCTENRNAAKLETLLPNDFDYSLKKKYRKISLYSAVKKMAL